MRSNEPNLIELTSKECSAVSGGIAPLVGLKIIAGFVYFLSGGKLVLSRMINGKPGTKSKQKPKPRGVRSDIRLKTNVRVEGTLPTKGVTVYSWEYTDLPGERFVGVMAQDLLARADLASAVFTFAEGPFKGFYGVNYDQLGLRCLPAEAFNGDVNSLLLQEYATA